MSYEDFMEILHGDIILKGTSKVKKRWFEQPEYQRYEYLCNYTKSVMFKKGAGKLNIQEIRNMVTVL